MLDKTRHLKKLFSEFKSLDVLRNAYKDYETHIFSCGSSLRNIDIPNLTNKLVFSIKQSYDFLKDNADLHFYNHCNYRHYDHHANCIRVLSTRYHRKKSFAILGSNAYDVFIQTEGKVSVASTKDFDRLDLTKHQSICWGPGIMYDSVIPLTVYAGIKRFFVYGWDIHYSSDPYFFDYNNTKIPSQLEMDTISESTDYLYDWLKIKGVEMIVGTDSPSISSRFARI